MAAVAPQPGKFSALLASLLLLIVRCETLVGSWKGGAWTVPGRREYNVAHDATNTVLARVLGTPNHHPKSSLMLALGEGIQSRSAKASP